MKRIKFENKYWMTLVVGGLVLANAGGMGNLKSNGVPSVGNPRAADAFEREAGIGATEADYEWWRDCRFGVFIHWGPGAFVHGNSLRWTKNPDKKPYYLKGHRDPTKGLEAIEDESWKKMIGKSFDPDIYNQLHRMMEIEDFDADAMVKMCKDAGAGYVVFTTKHHDGFCMWDSEFTDYDMMGTPSQRDVCRELADACKKYGLRLMWYYSKVDYANPEHDVDNPAAYDEYLYNQINELMTKYGDIEGIWWDGGKIQVDYTKLFDMMNRNHPGALSNGRIGKVPYGISFGSPEQRIGSFRMDRPWETCAVTGGSSWIWNGGNDVKSTTMGLHLLVNSAGGDGNLLLNFGPTPSGAVIEPVRDLYSGMGEWLGKYGESIRKTRGGPYKPGLWGASTRNGKNVYLHITQEWPGGEMTLPPLPVKVKKWKVLSGGKASVEQSEAGLVVRMDAKSHDAFDTIIKLTLDSDAMDIEPIDTLIDKTMTVDALVSASSSLNLNSAKGAPDTVVNYSFETGKFTKHFGEESDENGIEIAKGSTIKRNDEEIARIKKMVNNHRGHFWRYWSPKADDAQPWLALDLGEPKTFNRVHLAEVYEDIRGYELQYKKDGVWTTFHQGDRVENLSVQLAQPITAQEVRLLITKTSGDLPKLSMFDLL